MDKQADQPQKNGHAVNDGSDSDIEQPLFPVIADEGSNADLVISDANNATRSRARCWVVSNGRPGTLNQALGLARALERRLDISVHIKQVIFERPWRSLPFGLSGDPFSLLSSRGHLLRAPYPDLWIATGSDTIPLSLAIKKHSPSTFTIQTQHPRMALSKFDLVIPPEHDEVVGDNVIAMIGAPSTLEIKKVDREMATNADWFADLPEPRIAVLIGGNNKYKWLTPEILERLSSQLCALHEAGYSLVVTSSRRTDPAHLALLQRSLPKTRVRIFDATHCDVPGFNPYPSMLSGAAAIIVTEESINMISEAAMTGRPVYTLRMEGKYGKFGHFHKALRRRRITRTFVGAIDQWSYEPLNETERVADEIAQRILQQTAIRALD